MHFLQSFLRWNGFYPSSFLLNTFGGPQVLVVGFAPPGPCHRFHRQVGHRCQRHASWAEEIGRKMILSFKMLLPTGNPIPSPIPYPGTFESKSMIFRKLPGFRCSDMFSRSLAIFGNMLREFFGGVAISLGQLYCLPHYFLSLLGGKNTCFL